MATEKKESYLDLISKDEKQVQKESLKLKAQEAGLELNREIFNLTVKISAKEAEINKLKRAIPYSVSAEYRAISELETYKAQLEFAKTIKEERFADATI